MVLKARGEFVDVTESIRLTINIKDQNGNYVDLDSFPKISIIQPSGHVLIESTSIGITRDDTGKYSYVFDVPLNGPYGVYTDVWVGFINGFRLEKSLQFVVSHTEMPSPNYDGYVALGDDPGFDYSQTAIKNINKLLKSLKARLSSSGKAISKDGYGNKIYVDCDIFSIDMLVTFLATAIWDFNQVPYFTTFTFDDTDFIHQFGEILVERATLDALASKALIERGREFQITDNGINFAPPGVSDLMNTQYGTLLSHYWEKLKMIKASMRPAPIGAGVFSMTSGVLNPAVKALRHRRENRII